jgi:hypothetical protein
MVDPLSVFRMPPQAKITNRISSITNSFVGSIIPVVTPTSNDVAEALAVLGMRPETIECCYCGDTVTEWDHLRPLVVQKRPTGYISEIANLVPSCGKCNQSKGNKPWQTWIRSTARLSPTTRGVANLTRRIESIEAFERWRDPTLLDFEQVVDADLWTRHWDMCSQLHELMRESQATAEQIRSTIAGVALGGLGSPEEAARSAGPGLQAPA